MLPMSDPFTDYLVLDLLRCAIIAAALWLAVLVLRLTYQRWRGREADPNRYGRTHPMTMLSYAICLIAIVVRRADNLGTPWSGYVLFSIAVLITGYVGVLRRIRMDWRPPWRRSPR